MVPARWKTNRTPETSHGSDYFFNRIIRNNENDFLKAGISETTKDNLNTILKVELDDIEGRLREVIDNPVLMKEVFKREDYLLNDLALSTSSNCCVSKNDPKSIILQYYPNAILIISKDYDIASKTANMLKEKFNELARTTKDFGLTLVEFAYGKELAETRLKASEYKILSYKFKEPRNDLERQVITDIAKMTDCNLSNVEVFFDSPKESYEYDNLIVIDAETCIDVEVTDYQTAREKTHDNMDNLKSEIILNTLDKAQRLKATCVIIVRGFPKQTFTQIQELAQSRGIFLFDESNYKKSLEDIILSKFIQKYSEYEERTKYESRFAPRRRERSSGSTI